jgi:hypothetical protein
MTSSSKSDAYANGVRWVTMELERGTNVTIIEKYLNGSDDFDIGARDAIIQHMQEEN